MSKRTKYLLGIGVIAALVIGWQVVAIAASLPGSKFEIDTDANLIVNTAGNLDWANVSENRNADLASGSGDNSFGNGTKEDTAVPSVVSGSIPPNKSDLKNFGAYLETTPSGARFLNLFWHRVQEPSGTTNMDFELNQSSTLSGNGVTPVRTAGDLLIQYDLANGGTNPELFLSRWVTSGAGSQCQASNATPCWGTRVNLTTAGDATGSINTTAITAANADGLGNISPRTFGEAQIDFDALTGGSGTCTSFGSAYLKSRSSDSFTAALKDFIAPANVNLNNCATVIIRKQTNPEEDPNATNFGFTKAFATSPTSTNTFTLQDDGSKSFNNVLFGTGYTVTEDDIPAGWDLSNLDCSASTGVTPSINGATVTFAIDTSTDVLDCTYTNTLQEGALSILKNSTKGGAVSEAGAVFSYDGPSGTANVTDNGANDENPAVGEVCVPGLQPGDYDVTETSAPAGYGLPVDTAETATVVTGTDCTDNQPTGTAEVTFTDPPLADIQVNFRDGGSGETSATSISCDNTGTTPSTTPAPGWDDSVTHEDIAVDPSPRTITCTIEIDP